MSQIIECPTCQKKFRLPDNPPANYTCGACNTVMDLTDFGGRDPEPAAAPAGGGGARSGASRGGGGARRSSARRGGGGARAGGGGRAAGGRRSRAAAPPPEHDNGGRGGRYQRQPNNNTGLLIGSAFGLLALIIVVVVVTKGDDAPPEENPRENVARGTVPPDDAGGGSLSTGMGEVPGTGLPGTGGTGIPTPAPGATGPTPGAGNAGAGSTGAGNTGTGNAGAGDPGAGNAGAGNTPPRRGATDSDGRVRLRRYSSFTLQKLDYPEDITTDMQQQVEEQLVNLLEGGGPDRREAEAFFQNTNRGVLAGVINRLIELNGATGMDDRERMSQIMAIDRMMRKVDGALERLYGRNEMITHASGDAEATRVIKAWAHWFQSGNYQKPMKPWDPAVDEKDEEAEAEEGGTPTEDRPRGFGD